MNNLGKRLQELRKENGLSQGDLAERLSVSRQAVSKWEVNSAKPSIENIIQLSALYRVSADYLLKGETNRQVEGPIEQKEYTEKESGALRMRILIAIESVSILVMGLIIVWLLMR